MPPKRNPGGKGGVNTPSTTRKKNAGLMTPQGVVAPLKQTTHSSVFGAKLTRSNTIPSTQINPDCIQKAHSRILSNYFSYLLKTNDARRINKLSVEFDKALNVYKVQEDNASGGQDWVHGYGGGLSDVIAIVIAGIMANKPAPAYARIFTKKEIQKLSQVLNGFPKDGDGEPKVDIDSDDNVNDDATFRDPGDAQIIGSVATFINLSLLYPSPSNNPTMLLFKSYISVDILLVPSMYYWLGSLDGISNAISEGITPPPELMYIMTQELTTIRWDGIKYISSHAQDNLLQTYLSGKGIIVDPSTYVYPGHALVIKGYDPNYLKLGIECYLIQNSWGPSWNRKITKCTAGGSGRWINIRVIRALIYGVLRIIFPDNYWGQGITKRKKKPNKSKQSRRRIKTRRL